MQHGLQHPKKEQGVEKIGDSKFLRVVLAKTHPVPPQKRETLQKSMVLNRFVHQRNGKCQNDQKHWNVTRNSVSLLLQFSMDFLKPHFLGRGKIQRLAIHWRWLLGIWMASNFQRSPSKWQGNDMNFFTSRSFSNKTDLKGVSGSNKGIRSPYNGYIKNLLYKPYKWGWWVYPLTQGTKNGV